MKIILILLIALLAITIASPAVSGAQGIKWIIFDPTEFVLKGFVTYETIALNKVNVDNGTNISTTTNSAGYYEVSNLHNDTDYNIICDKYGFFDNNSIVNNTAGDNPYWYNVSMNPNALEPQGRHDPGGLIPGFNILMTIMIIFIVRRLLR